jgi:formate-dependent nitrite reductase membrane component NrfD
VLLIVGVVLVGLVAPLLLSWKQGLLRGSTVTAASVLVLIGGFVLRVVVVFSSEAI